MCLKAYHLDSVKFCKILRLKTKVKLELLTDINMLIMLKKELDEEYFTQFIDMQKLLINI